MSINKNIIKLKIGQNSISNPVVKSKYNQTISTSGIQEAFADSNLVDDYFLKGGYKVVSDITCRNNIPCEYRKLGMQVMVVGPDASFKKYVLKGNDPCSNEGWEELINATNEVEVKLVEDYSVLGESLNTQRDLNLKLKQSILNLQTQINNIELSDEKVQITEDTSFANIGQTQKDFNKNASDYKINSDLKNQEQDDRLTDIEDENAAQNDLINDLNSELDSERARNDAQDSRLINLEGINYIWSPTNRTLTLYDNNGTQLSQVSLVSLDNEGTDIRYNASTLSLELYNADNELLDSIPVSSFIGSVGTQLQLNSNQLQLKDSQGNILSTVSFSIVNIPGLQTALDSKLNKGSFPGNASDLKSEIDGKLNKPTTTSTTTSYPYVVGEDGNGNSARLPAGDLGKNFFNSDLSNTTARNHTMNAGVTVNTLGNPHTLSGLPNKNTDIANFRKVRVQNTSGLDGVVDSKNLLTDGVTSMTDAEKDAWRLAQRKTGENYSLGQPRVDVIFPKILSKQITGVQYMSLIGINLFVNITSPTTSVTMINTSTNQEYLISNIQVSQTNQQILSFGLDFVNIPGGTYRFRVINNGLQNIDTTTFTVSNGDLYITDLSALTWAKDVANGTFASSFGQGNTAYRDSNRNSNVGSFSSVTERGLLLVSNEILNTQEANANWWIEIESSIPSTGLDYFGNTHIGITDSYSPSLAIQSLIPSYGLFICGDGFSCFPDNVAVASARNFSGTVKTHIIKQASLVTVLVIINNTIYRSVTFSIITQFTGIKLMLASAVGLQRTYDNDWSIINTFKLIKF